MLGTVPPFVKSLKIKRSPLVCVPLKVPLELVLTGLTKNQKPIDAAPLSDVRSPAKRRIQLLVPVNATAALVISPLSFAFPSTQRQVDIWSPSLEPLVNWLSKLDPLLATSSV